MPRINRMREAQELRGLPSKSWTMSSWFSGTTPGADKFGALLEKLKGAGSPSTERLEHKILHGFNMACQNVVFHKTGQVWVAFLVFTAGFTGGSFLVVLKSTKHPMKDESRGD